MLPNTVTNARQETSKNQFITGMYIWPMNFLEVWIILRRGKQPRAVACFMVEKIAVVIARLAISAAKVAMNTTGQNAWPATWIENIYQKGARMTETSKTKVDFITTSEFYFSKVQQYIINQTNQFALLGMDKKKTCWLWVKFSIRNAACPRYPSKRHGRTRNTKVSCKIWAMVSFRRLFAYSEGVTLSPKQ